MPGVRSEGQTLIGVWCDASFVDKIDKLRGNRSRSQFCRDAIAESLRQLGIAVAASESLPPDRIGKGGPKSTTYRIRRPKLANLNEKKK